MKKIFFLLMFISVTTFAQKKSINNYKYIIVPKQFEFVSKADGYQTSSLTKFLFEKYGFTALLSDEVLPKDVARNRCLALIGEVKDKSGMLTTKSVIELKDCSNNVVFTSEIGKSKIKNFKKAYHEAIRKAFKSIQRLNYKYVPLQEEEIIATDISSQVTPIKEEKITLPPVTTIPKKAIVEKTTTSSVLYAQPKTNGYQLVNTKPEVVYELLNTGVKDVFILKNKKGILYKNNNTWIAEYYENDNKVQKNMSIKF